MSGEVQDNASLSAEEINTLLLNSQIVIDQTNFTGQNYVTTVGMWRELAGFASAQDLPVLAQKKVYSLDNTVNDEGSSGNVPGAYDLFSRSEPIVASFLTFLFLILDAFIL